MVNLINTPAAAVGPNVSKINPETYGFVSTEQIVEQLGRHGWYPTSLKFGHARKAENAGFQKHLMRFQHDEFSGLLGEGNRLEMAVLNAHDGTSALKMLSGVFRIACLNGNILGDIGESLRVTHSNRLIRDLNERTEEFAERMPLVAERMKELRGRQFSTDQLKEFQKMAAEFATRNIPAAVIQEFGHVSRIRRLADTANDAFTVTNRIQETLLRGGVKYLVTDERNNPIHKTTRAVNSVTESVRRNQFVWDTAELLLKSA